MTTYKTILCERTVRELCEFHGWFDNFESTQSKNLHQLINDGASIEELAAAIWNSTANSSLSEIQEKLFEAARLPLSVDTLIRQLRNIGYYGEYELALIREIIVTHQDAGKAYRVV